MLDEGTYLGSQSTFYRLLRQAGETRERRCQATHPAAAKPELAASGPNQVWVLGHHQAARPGLMPETKASLRSRTRALVRSEVRASAMRLFTVQGFDDTTIGQIADEAGVSQSSVFRYFPTKEDLVVGESEDYADRLRVTLENRPNEESAWDALRETMRVRAAVWQDDPAAAQQVLSLLASSESLRARHRQKITSWQQALVPETQQRLGGHDEFAAMRAHALISATSDCLDAAFRQWHDSNQAHSLDDLFEIALSAVRPQQEGGRIDA